MDRRMTVNELVSLVVQSESLGGVVRLVGDGTCIVRDVTHDSARVVDGSVFCCVVGDRHDGHEFAQAAIAQGAACVVVQRELNVAVPQIVVSDSRRAAGIFAAAFHAWPSDRLRVVGVTGTNGKTTSAHLLAAILHQAGLDTAILGTLSGARTTPEATDLQRMMADFVRDGKKALVMEVTSHALALDRVIGTRFDVSVFTNLSKDHLDFHGTEERYFAAKARLFAPDLSERGVINRDDVHGRLLLDSATIPCTSFGLDDVRDVEVTARHHSYSWRGHAIRVPLGGRFNVWNSIGAATAASELGVSDAAIATGLSQAKPVPGRFEIVEAGNDVAVIVDYAHDASSLARVIESARESSAPGIGVVVVFGCGGERDVLKRPEMGAVAAALADAVVITNDNPRGEDPQMIASSIVSGIADEHRSKLVAIELDRRRAIECALDFARSGDVVIVAGKGHESTQTIGDTVAPFNDAQVVREIVGSST
jgi:UDP-N-acetylmuramoyl-L-alanyl-D-glutamate--2,6-diaminopimelate ligase